LPASPLICQAELSAQGLIRREGFMPPHGAGLLIEPVPKLIDCALTRAVLDQALAVSQAFSLAKLRILRLLFQN
jgi:hypothetical protein